MKKLGALLILAILIFFATTSFSAKLVNYTYLPGDSEINFVFIYDDEPEEFDIQRLDYGRYIVINTPGEISDLNSINRFIGYSPIIGFKASSGKGQISYQFDMLLPREPQVEIVANTLRITFQRNTEMIREFSSYTDSTQSGDRPSIMALLSVLREYMDINLVIDEASLKGIQPVEFVMLSEDLRAEDFFLQIVMNNPKIAYAFLPNNTVYVVRKELLASKIEEILAETSLSPQQETSYWAAYNFRINKKSTLYEQFANRYTESQTNSELRFSVENFKDYIQANFETYIRETQGSMNEDIITLAKGGDDDEEYVPVGLLLYGDNNRHERFTFFIRFLEGVSFTGDGSTSEEGNQSETSDYLSKINYAPLTQEEVREFMDFYVNFRTRLGIPKQEMIPEYEEIVFEILPLINQIQITGPVNATKKITSYLTDYINNRKARGNEKITEIKVKDGYGTVFAIALRRLFPKAIVDSAGININTLVNKPTFEWTYEDVKGFGSKDGNPDSVTVFGSNYEIQTAQKIADDWGWLVPPLSSEIRIISMSEEMPENIKASLNNPESPNSLQNKFPDIELDFSFSPLLFAKGKEHDLAILEGYIREIEEISLGKPYSYFYRNDDENKNWKKYRLSLSQNTAMYNQYLKEESKTTSISEGAVESNSETDYGYGSETQSSTEYETANDNSSVMQITATTTANDNSNDSQAAPVRTSTTSKTTTIREAPKVSFDMDGFSVDFRSNFEKYLKLPVGVLEEDIIITYEINQQYNTVVIILLLYGTEELQDMFEEFTNAYEGLEITEIEGDDFSVYMSFERITPTDVSVIFERLFKGKSINFFYIQSRDLYKIYGVEKNVKAFIEELRKIDARRPDESTLLMRETELVNINIPSLTSQEVIQLVNINVPAVQIESFGAGGYFITGLDSEIDQAKEFLESIGTDFMEESVILNLAPGITFKTISDVLNLYYNSNEIQLLDFQNSNVLLKGRKEKTQNAKLILSSFGLIRVNEDDLQKVVKRVDYEYEEDSEKVPPEEINAIINSYYPGIESQYFEKASVFLLIGSQSNVDQADDMITEYANKIVIEKVGFSIEGDRYSPEEILLKITEEYPGLKKISIDAENNLFQIVGSKNMVENAKLRLMQLAQEKKTEPEKPVLSFKEDGLHFDLYAQGKSVLELTQEIAKGISLDPKLFLPEETSTITSKLEMSDLTWEQWLKITERLYDFKVEIVEGLAKPIYVITPPGSEHETGTTKKRTLNISHGFSEVSALISGPFGGEVYADETNGLVLFTGVSDAKMKELKPLILNTVEPRKMVEIKAMVIDNKIIDNLNTSYGVSFSANSEDAGFSLDNNGFSFNGSILSFTDYANLLDLLTNKLSVNVSTTGAKTNSDDHSIIKPYITTMSGESANINIGENYKYRIQTTDQEGNIVEEVLTVPVGNLLNITPKVNNDDTITMEISVEISSIAGFSSDGLPNTNTRNVSSIVTVNDGDTIVMGGLEGESKNYSEEKLPFFGDLPIIGKLFTWEIENKDNRSVTIFLTPRIIETKGKPMQIFGQNID